MMDILVTRHLTLRPLLEVDADDLCELIAKEPMLIGLLPKPFATLIGLDDKTGSFDAVQSLVVIKEKVVGWVSSGEAKETGFSSYGNAYRAEALTVAQSYFDRQSNQFAT